ncbi:hypothetical protein [Hyalangium gracile]|uniref:hypothetical protein n=1 Tax=Hyalangium gracile TaxID=394092 RepID=UPI001CCAF4C4|nr:hypothetical protein [Hyalangium gracile]
MPRTLTQEEEARFMRWAQQRDQLFLSLRHASIPERIQAYKQLEKQILGETRTAFEKQEMRRRIAEDLLRTTSSGPWRSFSPYLRRMERLGYSSMDCRLLVCAWSAQASKGSAAGIRKTAALISDFERRTRGRPLHPAQREQIDLVLARARTAAGLDARKALSEESRPQRKPRTRSRRSRG